jgi:hypothetical protein
LRHCNFGKPVLGNSWFDFVSIKSEKIFFTKQVAAKLPVLT